jgi:hypothetical protein
MLTIPTFPTSGTAGLGNTFFRLEFVADNKYEK